MKNKTKEERTEIALKAAASRKRNKELLKKKYSERAKKAVASRKKNMQIKDFKGQGHEVNIYKTLDNALLDKQSPKTGVVLCLPNHFAHESKLIKMEQLSGLVFKGFEFSYNPTKSKESERTARYQRYILKQNKYLAERITLAYQDINSEILMWVRQSIFSHLFLDYCGSFTTNKNAIAHAIKHDLLEKGGLMWITLSCKGGAIKGINANTNTKLRKLIKENGGNRYEFVPFEGLMESQAKGIFKYKSTKCGHTMGITMYTCLIRRVK